MTPDDDACYRALAARDVRFDGLFFVGVKTTGIYCRSVCPAKTPRRSSCRFFSGAALAERAGFRPCLRCRPELAPGHTPLDAVRNIARAAAARIEAGALSAESDHGKSLGGLERLAATLGLSSRQLRRAVRREFGVSPIALAQTQRLLLAKRLIAETELPMTQVAFASGFASVRRFNALFRKHYRLAPTELRRGATKPLAADCLKLTLAYRPPFDWPALLEFLAARAIPGVEYVTDESYRRTVAIGEHRGALQVTQCAGRDALSVELSPALAPALSTILIRLRSLFDLDARPDVVAAHLSQDPRLAKLLALRPGLRVPGAFDSFELGLRAILGQQISVKGASTLAGRFARRFGEPVAMMPASEANCLDRFTPVPDVIAAARTTTLAGLGVPSARAEALRSFAGAVARGELDLEPGGDPTAVNDRLSAIPGIGPWTAEYIAMRALRRPDAFPSGDLGLLKAMGRKSAKELERAAEPWRPWRSYAAMHLWQTINSEPRAAASATNPRTKETSR